MAPLQVDPSDYLKPHHSAGRCPQAWLVPRVRMLAQPRAQAPEQARGPIPVRVGTQAPDPQVRVQSAAVQPDRSWLLPAVLDGRDHLHNRRREVPARRLSRRLGE